MELIDQPPSEHSLRNGSNISRPSHNIGEAVPVEAVSAGDGQFVGLNRSSPGGFDLIR